MRCVAVVLVSPGQDTSCLERSRGDGEEGGRRPSGERQTSPVHLHVVPQVGPGREALVAVLAGERLLLGVETPVAHERCGHTEGLAAVRTLVAFGLCVNTTVVLEGHQVGELFLAGVTEVGPSLVTVLVVEEGAGVAVRPPTLTTDEAPGTTG